ncbi:unnamed protein product [Mytilus coruscus]|uniref:Uncharacterized protein n=1 Tax=Mytilus coruscus TaxID=42192 RepID=A0A6J8AMS4_MYTCO|nr:unnamed protein product [Mytilus coruscus]
MSKWHKQPTSKLCSIKFVLKRMTVMPCVFLWCPNGDLNQKPRSYCMQVHLFGAKSSPSCSGYALKRTVRDNSHLFDPEVVSSTVENKNYVDDCLKSVSSEQKAIKLAIDLQSLMEMGGFQLTKWLINSRDVLKAIPESELAPAVVNLSPGDVLPNDKVAVLPKLTNQN